VHKHTLNASYLATARRMGQYFLDHVPSNGIVPWDFQAPLVQNGVPRPADSSGAMVAVNGMLLIAHQEEVIGNASGSAWWSSQAMNVSGFMAMKQSKVTDEESAILQQCSVRVEAILGEPPCKWDSEQPYPK
jgi:hypothetical protein